MFHLLSIEYILCLLSRDCNSTCTTLWAHALVCCDSWSRCQTFTPTMLSWNFYGVSSAMRMSQMRVIIRSELALRQDHVLPHVDHWIAPLHLFPPRLPHSSWITCLRIRPAYTGKVRRMFSHVATLPNSFIHQVQKYAVGLFAPCLCWSSDRRRLVLAIAKQCFCCSQCIGCVTPKTTLDCYLKWYLQDQRIPKT